MFILFVNIVLLKMSIKKFAFEYDRLKEKNFESQKESIDKFVISNKQNII